MAVPTYCGPITWNILRLMQKMHVLPYISFSVGARVLGQKVRIPIDRGNGVHGLPIGEPWAHLLFEPLLKAFPGTFVDVGVNLGQTLVRIRTMAPNTPYIGFEPNPICVQYARELVRMNGWENYPVVPVGLSDRDAVLDLVMNNDDLTDSGASLVHDFRPGVKVHHRIPVVVLAFDTVHKDMSIGRSGVVKIDVEGAELEVLLGMKARIEQDRPALFLEILPVGSIAAEQRLPRQLKVEALFSELNYKLIRVRNKGVHSCLEPIHGAIGVHDDPDLANYLVIPGERYDELYPLLDNAMAQQ
jgi:FkbM family methyltransferase